VILANAPTGFRRRSSSAATFSANPVDRFDRGEGLWVARQESALRERRSRERR
jgi:hypothetical protein